MQKNGPSGDGPRPNIEGRIVPFAHVRDETRRCKVALRTLGYTRYSPHLRWFGEHFAILRWQKGRYETHLQKCMQSYPSGSRPKLQKCHSVYTKPLFSTCPWFPQKHMKGSQNQHFGSPHDNLFTNYYVSLLV